MKCDERPNKNPINSSKIVSIRIVSRNSWAIGIEKKDHHQSQFVTHNHTYEIETIFFFSERKTRPIQMQCRHNFMVWHAKQQFTIFVHQLNKLLEPTSFKSLFMFIIVVHCCLSISFGSFHLKCVYNCYRVYAIDAMVCSVTWVCFDESP